MTTEGIASTELLIAELFHCHYILITMHSENQPYMESLQVAVVIDSIITTTERGYHFKYLFTMCQAVCQVTNLVTKRLSNVPKVTQLV